MTQTNSKQRCLLVNVYGSAFFFVLVVAALLWFHQPAMAIGALIALPLGEWLYVRQFPRISRSMGYGDVSDRPAAAPPRVAAGPGVTIYTAIGCPFCPLVEQRLEALQKSMGFPFEKIDVTLRPALLASKGIRSVPVVEIGDTRLTGLMTTEQLAAALSPVTSTY